MLPPFFCIGVHSTPYRFLMYRCAQHTLPFVVEIRDRLSSITAGHILALIFHFILQLLANQFYKGNYSRLGGERQEKNLEFRRSYLVCGMS